MADKPCLWCGEPSTKLCDGLVGVLDLSRLDSAQTCDAPMCHRCAHQAGHVCGRGAGGCDSIDHCPTHAIEPGDARRVLTETETRLFRAILHRLVKAQPRLVGGTARTPEPGEVYGRIFGTDGYTREFL